ncbi:hypothetical protein D9M70_567880 [compost metagenome]
MGVQHHELADTLVVKITGNAEPALDRLAIGKGSAAGDIHVLDGVTDRLGRQEGYRQAGGHGGDRAGDDALGDQRVGFEGQMRTVLFMGAERQHGDPVTASVGRKVGPIVLPSRLRHRHFSSILHVNCRKIVI